MATSLLLAAVCAGRAISIVSHLGNTTTADSSVGASGPNPLVTGRVAAPAGANGAPAAGGVADAPRPSSYPVRTEDDLKRVCDRWFYPKSPAYAARGPRPIVITEKDDPDLDFRTTKSFYGVAPDGGSSRATKAWNPKSMATVQLVACVDRVKIGKQIRTCPFDTPTPAKVPLVEGIYRLTLYEVSTRRKVTEATMTGEGETCPTIASIGEDNRLFSEINDRQYVETLHRYVER